MQVRQPKWTLLISISVAIILFWQYLGRLLLLHIFLFQSLLPELSHRCTEKEKKNLFSSFPMFPNRRCYSEQVPFRLTKAQNT